jgi:uncharacterized protein (TIGR02145 family)
MKIKQQIKILLLSTLITFALCLSTSPSFADSWGRPRPIRYYSENGNYMLLIFPKASVSDYISWHASSPGTEQGFTNTETHEVPCHAVLFKVHENDTTEIYQTKLINRLAPANAIVCNEGKSIVTFDNWGSVGTGSSVMVIYDENGELLNQYSLNDISPIPIENYMKTTSSIWWRCQAKYTDTNTIEIHFCDIGENIFHKSFNVKESNKASTFTDLRDGKTYKTVKIGNQTWMAENLNYKTRSGSWCYAYKKRNCNKYGRLYNWRTANTVCPPGWKLPSKSDFEILLNSAGSSDSDAYNALILGGNTGFSALFGGFRRHPTFTTIGVNASFWSSSPYDSGNGMRLRITSHNQNAEMSHGYLSWGLSVRCIKID